MNIFLFYLSICSDFTLDISAQHILTQALYLGNPSDYNTTKEDCIWKHGNDRDVCPDPNINIILYTSGEKRGKLWVRSIKYINIYIIINLN